MSCVKDTRLGGNIERCYKPEYFPRHCTQLAHTVGPHICLLKTHADIMTDFTMETASNLKMLAQQHNFIVMEDRYACLIHLFTF